MVDVFSPKFLEESGITEVSAEEIKNIAAEEFKKTFEANYENGFDVFIPQILTIIVSKKDFERFIKNNPDFSNYGESYEFNWSSIKGSEILAKNLMNVEVYKVEKEFILICY